MHGEELVVEVRPDRAGSPAARAAARITAASAPPSSRKTKRGDDDSAGRSILWSTVESQPIRLAARAPGPARGAASSSASPSAVSRRSRPVPARARPRSFQALEIGDDDVESSGSSFIVGMLTPGLMPCGSAIQAARLPRLIGSVPAASVAAAADMGQVGPDRPPAGVPRTEWHMTQGRDRKACSPFCRSGSSGGSAGCDLRVAPARRRPPRPRRRRGCPYGRAAGRRTRRIGRGRCPAGRPRGGCRSRWPGIRSCLPMRLGTQKQWITSADSSLTVHRPAGRDVDLVCGREDCGSRRRPRSGPPTTIGGR